MCLKNIDKNPGFDPKVGGTPQELGTYMDEEREKWGDVLKQAGIELQ